MSLMLPPSRSKNILEEALANHLSHADKLAKHPIVMVGYRGYYRDSMSKPVVNDRSIFNGCAVLLVPNLGTNNDSA